MHLDVEYRIHQTSWEATSQTRESHLDPARLENRAEFRRLFDAHFEELARYAYRYVQSIDDAKDLVHDAFFRLWQPRQVIYIQPRTIGVSITKTFR